MLPEMFPTHESTEVGADPTPNWGDKNNNTNINNSPYQYCNVGPAAFDVKQSCS